MMIMEDNLNLDGNGQKRPPVMDSKYRMILVAAQRSKQLQRNARPRVGMDPAKHKPTRIALEEVKKEMVNFEITEE
jgi:DNA-directed RNA polymerase subunit omega